jgi:hypothetical protein
MLYRDFMEKFRPLYSPDEVGAAATDGAAAAAAVPAASTGAEGSAVTAGAAPADGAAAAPAPSVEAAAPAADAPKPDSAPTLLEAADGKKPEAKPEGDAKKEDPAPADPKPEADAKPKDDKPKDDAGKKDGAADPEKKDATAEAPPAPIKYEAFKLPDGLKLDDKELGKFTELAGKAQIPQDVAQNLVDLYVAERQNDVAQARADQRKVWDTLNDTWKTELRNHPELGGNKLETTLSMAKAVIEEYLPANEVGEYMAHMRNNGMGNYLLHVKLLRNIGKALNVFEDGIVPANAQAPKPTKSPGNRGWYDKSLNGGGPA